LGNQRGGLSAYQMSYNTDGTTAVQDIDKQDFATIFPNPTSGQLTITFPSNIKDEIKQIQVFNAMGQCLKTNAPPQYEMDFSGFTNGIYIIKIQTQNGKQQITKVVKR
jgi:hypothetical protein